MSERESGPLGISYSCKGMCLVRDGEIVYQLGIKHDAPTEDALKHAFRCDSACHAAGVVNPGTLAEFVLAAKALREGNNHLDGQSDTWNAYAQPFDAALAELEAMP